MLKPTRLFDLSDGSYIELGRIDYGDEALEICTEDDDGQVVYMEMDRSGVEAMHEHLTKALKLMR